MAKRSASSSSVKKKWPLGKSFNLKSRKVQFFVVILIVAVLGGGYFTFKSFAAEVGHYYASNGTLVCRKNIAVCTQRNDEAKNNVAVVELSQVGIADSNSQLYMVKGNVYRTCIKGRGVGKFLLYPRELGSETATLSNRDALADQCTPNYTFSGTTRYVTASIEAMGGWGRIQQLWVELITVAPVNQSCGKNCP